jgi:hypothetical protein
VVDTLNQGFQPLAATAMDHFEQIKVMGLKKNEEIGPFGELKTLHGVGVYVQDQPLRLLLGQLLGWPNHPVERISCLIDTRNLYDDAPHTHL